jgi:hypothetical protein
MVKATGRMPRDARKVGGKNVFLRTTWAIWMDVGGIGKHVKGIRKDAMGIAKDIG